jgi:hypothetical protein
MTDHSCALDFDLDQQGIEIAIRRSGSHFQAVAGGFPFRPKFISRTAVERDVSDRESFLERVAVHEAKHEDVACRILNDCGHQALHFVEINIHIASCIQRKINSPRRHEKTWPRIYADPHGSKTQKGVSVLIRLDRWLEGFAFAHFSLVKTNKKPAELYASAGLESCACCPNSAPHTRRRAMRVMMVVVMVLSQHEKVDYVRVVPESIRKIGWK